MRKLALALAAIATLATSIPLTVGTAEAQAYRTSVTRYGYGGVSHSTTVRNRYGATSRTVYRGRNGRRCVTVAHTSRTYFGARRVTRRRCN